MIFIIGLIWLIRTNKKINVPRLIKRIQKDYDFNPEIYCKPPKDYADFYIGFDKTRNILAIMFPHFKEPYVVNEDNWTILSTGIFEDNKSTQYKRAFEEEKINENAKKRISSIECRIKVINPNIPIEDAVKTSVVICFNCTPNRVRNRIFRTYMSKENKTYNQSKEIANQIYTIAKDYITAHE